MLNRIKLYVSLLILSKLSIHIFQTSSFHRAIYSKLKEAVSEEESEVYASRLQELEVKLRFCRHHLGDKMATDTLLAMRGSEALGDKLDVSISFCVCLIHVLLL